LPISTWTDASDSSPAGEALVGCLARSLFHLTHPSTDTSITTQKTAKPPRSSEELPLDSIDAGGEEAGDVAAATVKANGGDSNGDGGGDAAGGGGFKLNGDGGGDAAGGGGFKLGVVDEPIVIVGGGDR